MSIKRQMGTRIRGNFNRSINMLANTINLYLNNKVLQLVADTGATEVIHFLLAWARSATKGECLCLSTHLKLQLHEVYHWRVCCTRWGMIAISLILLSHSGHDININKDWLIFYTPLMKYATPNRLQVPLWWIYLCTYWYWKSTHAV